MVVYPDASFLFSLYAQDANTPQASQIGRTLKTPLATAAGLKVKP